MPTFQTISVMLAGLSVTTAAIFHVVGLIETRRARKLAVETRQVQLMMQLNERLSGESWQDFENILKRWSWTDFDDFMAKYGPVAAPTEWAKLMRTAGHWEHVGLLVRDGVVSSELVWHWVGSYPVRLWEKIEPVVEGYRERFETPPKGMMFEWYEDLTYRLRDERERDVQAFAVRSAQRAETRKRHLPAATTAQAPTASPPATAKPALAPEDTSA